MKNYLEKAFYRQIKLVILFALGISVFSSCKDIYNYDNEEPDFLGGSVYDYLKTDGHYTNFVRLIDDLNYTEVLQLTGSKTLFVSNDSAFTEFYKSNEWGITAYDQFTIAQKKSILNYAMINNSYVMDMYANYYSAQTLFEGTAMRRQTALANIDSIPFEKPENIPASEYWNSFRTRGMYLLKDNMYEKTNTNIPMVFFTQSFIDKYGLTDEDFYTLTNGQIRVKGDAFIFDNKIIKRDVVCKNGYIHVLDKVMLPRTNMAEYITKNPDTKIFSKLLDRFSAPYYDEVNTLLYRQLHPEFKDSIFYKSYFSINGGRVVIPSGSAAKNMLPYNPGWNSYQSSALQADMATMFVPSDQAMTDYFNSGVGAILKNRFGSWDNVPDEIILPFLKRHMRNSLIESVPSKFSKMVDAENYRLPVEKSHIEKSYTGVNGEVYITNSVYPPVDYISVYSPVLLSENSKIMNWVINRSETASDKVTVFAFYKLYLNSLVSKYGLFIPTDEYFSNYIDPIAYGQDVSGVLKYWFNAKQNMVNATVYKYDKVTGVVGDSVDVINTEPFLKNRLWDLLDSHIVVGDIKSGSDYYITKANDIIKVSGGNKIQGGGDIQNNVFSTITKEFNQYNGTTYFLDKPIQPSLKSVYKTLSEKTEFSEFYALLNGVPDTCVAQIFAKQGIDYRVKFFNAYRYTIYVPTNEAITNAIGNGKLKSWDVIYAMTDVAARSIEINKMIRFLKYHFQDNAVFANQIVNAQYQSATIKNDNTATQWRTSKNKYYKIGVVGNGSTLTLTMDTPTGEPVKTAKVVTDNGLYNIVVKDYIFSKVPSAYKNVDGTGIATGLLFNTSTISTSASAVIHQIDNILTIE